MELMKHNTTQKVTPALVQSNRRGEARLSGQLAVTFSGMDGTQMVIETGVVTDLCQDGVGIQAERPVKQGMEMALIIQYPNSEDHVCVPESCVAWVSGDRFGVSIRTITPKDQERLRQMFLSVHRPPQNLS